MRYKNSIKIVFSNFNIVWKSMLYFLGVAVFASLLLYFSVSPIFELLKTSGFVTNVVETYTEFLTSLNFSEFMLAIKDLGADIIRIFSENMSTIWINFTLIALILGFVVVVFNHLAIYPMSNSLNYYMSSINSYSFYGSLSDTFGKSLEVTLVKYLVSLPIDFIIAIIVCFSLGLFNTKIWIVSFFAPFLIMLIVVVLFAIKSTLFACWVPTMVTLNYGVLKSLGVGIKTSFRYFWKVFGTAVGMTLTVIVLNVFLGLFTFGAGFLISIPASFLLYSAFGMVVTFEGLGMRYYVDVYNVITPPKKEKSDKFEDMRYIV